MKDPYAVLGLSKGADAETLKAKYKELHDIYYEQRFKAGEEGNEGARKLQELEEAWAIINAELDRKGGDENQFDGDYGKVDSLIRDGKYNEAQDLLDSITDRRGEWHYMQAIVFYKREWLSEAKTQLEMALQDDPNNSKYRTSLDKLNIAITGGGKEQAQAQPVNQNTVDAQGDAQSQPQTTGDTMSNCLSSCCCAYCLTDCLCTSMRCC